MGEINCWRCRDTGIVVVSAVDVSAGISAAQSPSKTLPCPQRCAATEEAREVGMPKLERIAADAHREHVEALHAQALVENEQLGWSVARKGAERALAVLRQASPPLAEAELDHFGEGTLGIEKLSDLIADLFHLAYRNGGHPEEVVRAALNDWSAENDDEASDLYLVHWGDDEASDAEQDAELARPLLKP